MNPNTDFIQNLFEKLSNLKNKKTLIKDETASKVNDLKSAPSSTPQILEGDKTPSSPGTPQVVDTKRTKELKESNKDTGKSETSYFSDFDNKSINRWKETKQGNKKIPEKENQIGEVEEQIVEVGQIGEVEKRTDQMAGEVGREEYETRSEFVHKNQKTQVGEDLFSVTKNQLLDLQKQEAERVAQKNAQAEQASYMVKEPPSHISKIRGERPIPFYSVAGLAVVYTLPYIQRFLKNIRLKQKKKNKEEEVSFFVNTYVIIRPIEIGE